MVRRWGSWLPLLAFAVAVLLLFSWQRSRSTFLQIEAERDTARELTQLARAHDPGVSIADVLALRDMVGLDAEISARARDTSDIAAREKQARRGRGELEEAVAVAIRELTTDAVVARRFLLMRERFAGGS